MKGRLPSIDIIVCRSNSEPNYDYLSCPGGLVSLTHVCLDWGYGGPVNTNQNAVKVHDVVLLLLSHDTLLLMVSGSDQEHR